MRIFDPLYQKCMQWAKHKRASWLLVSISTAESVIFPIPTDVMLAPMVLANRERAWFLAFITTVSSVIGGIIGYALGYFAFESWILPLIEQAGYMPKYEKAVESFKEYGVWVVFIAGFSPIPYKVFTVTAGALAMPLLPFTIASFFGRAGRFYLVAGLLYWGGNSIEKVLQKYVERIGWATVILVALGILLYQIW